MHIFPKWADLGDTPRSDDTINTWEQELSRANEYYYYFSGEVFNERVRSEDVEQENAPLLYPVGVNLVRMLALAHADAMYGDWDELPLQWRAARNQEANSDIKRAMELADQILIDNKAGRMLWELELNRQVYGGGAIKIAPDFAKPGRIAWSLISRGSFFPIWDPEDPDTLLEAVTWSILTKEQLRLKFGIETSKSVVSRVERWTPYEHEFIIDGQQMPQYSGFNPYGIVPFEYIPRYRFGNWFGEALTDDLIDPQNEINMRLADLAEAVNYNAHPTRYGLNLPSDFNAENFPLGVNSMWDLGRALGSSPPPEVGVLEIKNPIPQGAFEYINFIYDWSRTSTFAPPIAFGEDNGGGQRSGITLEIRLWPLLKSIKRSRSYLAAGLKGALLKSAYILKQKEFSGMPQRAVQAMINGAISPNFHKVLPRDQQALVDEVVKLTSCTPPMISIESAQDILGRGEAEVDRIVNMLQDERFQTVMERAFANQANGEDEDDPVADEGEKEE